MGNFDGIPDYFDQFINAIPDDLPDEIAEHLASALLRAALVLLGGDVAIIVCQHNPNCDSPTCTASAVGTYMPAIRTGFSNEGAAHLMRAAVDLFERDITNARR